MSTLKILFAVISILSLTNGAKILCIFNMASYSHYILGHRLLEELSFKGHDVTMVSPYKNDNVNKHYNNVQLENMKEDFEKMMANDDVNMMEMLNMSPFFMNVFIHEMGLFATDYTLKHPTFQKLLNNQYDAVIIEAFYNDALRGVCDHFKAPCIAMSTIGSGLINDYLVGNPISSAYNPDFLLGYSTPMTFCQRIYNTVYQTFQIIARDFVFMRKQNTLMHKYFPNAPHVDTLNKNTSILFLNSHPSVIPPMPYTPNTIEIGGFHVRPPKKLPADLQAYMDGAKNGVILFSLGSNVKSKDLPEAKRNAILKAFGKLDMKVLWKFEEDDLPGKPVNVKISKWLPQQDILSHPNLKLFITHGGLLSTLEAIHHGVPLIGIPFMADQKFNIANNVKLGIAVQVNFDELDEITLTEAMSKVLKNKSYSENMKYRSELIHDRPIKPLDAAVYWTEYAIKHKGAPHLNSPSHELNYYQASQIDVKIFFALITIVPLLLLSCAIKKLFCKKKCCKAAATNAKKIN